MTDATTTRTTAPYGAWVSPITTDVITGATIRLGQPKLDGDDLYWLEGRPAENGRNALMRASAAGESTEVLPGAWNVRDRVHEYGGGAYAVHNGIVVFSDDRDGRLYRFNINNPGTAPAPLTPDAGERVLRYADMTFDPARNRVIAVREDHRGSGEAVNTLVAISLAPTAAGDEGTVLVSGPDFVSSPAVSADGARFAWLSWQHPNMPWDSVALSVSELDSTGAATNARQVAGGENISVFQPLWLPDGSLVYSADPTGWWNLYRLADPLAGGDATPLWPMNAECGAPQWTMGTSTSGVLGDGRLVTGVNERGVWSLHVLNPLTGDHQPLASDYDAISSVQAAGNRVAYLGGAATRSGAVVVTDVSTGATRVVKEAIAAMPPAAYLSRPEVIEFPTSGGDNWTAFGLYYPPTNPDFQAPAGELPPLIVLSHGGPTGQTSTSLSLGIQFWTSRGYAVLDVNYGGSTGYGREYRERLKGNWGIVDVADCVNGARALVDRGLADPKRLIIRGGSAGGYTTLAALAFTDVFAAGSSHFGISDLETMATDTHKFESRYLDGLVAPYPAGRDVYLARSPIHFLHQLSSPVIFLQGLEDKVVPPDQSEKMFNALVEKGLPAAYVPFEGEQHGFSRGVSITRSYEVEQSFFGQIFGFTPADSFEPVKVENLG